LGSVSQWGAEKLRVLTEGLQEYAIVPFDEPMAETWAQIADRRARLGRPIETGDCWIAATAVRHDMPLVTHNAKHHADIPGLRVISHAAR
jgi:tRNA(fMet)-specific endonuclease VapC